MADREHEAKRRDDVQRCQDVQVRQRRLHDLGLRELKHCGYRITIAIPEAQITLYTTLHTQKPLLEKRKKGDIARRQSAIDEEPWIFAAIARCHQMEKKRLTELSVPRGSLELGIPGLISEAASKYASNCVLSRSSLAIYTTRWSLVASLSTRNAELSPLRHLPAYHLQRAIHTARNMSQKVYHRRRAGSP